MNLKKVKLSIVVLAVGLTNYAQQATIASGGDISGSGGSVSYSIGEVFYNTNVGTGTITQGIQQPYEISTVLGLENQFINLNIIAYPNPTTSNLILNVSNIEISDLSFELYNINGKLMERKKIKSTSEIIEMENLPSSTYILKVIDNKKEKTFKIIKK